MPGYRWVQLLASGWKEFVSSPMLPAHITTENGFSVIIELLKDYYPPPPITDPGKNHSRQCTPSSYLHNCTTPPPPVHLNAKPSSHYHPPPPLSPPIPPSLPSTHNYSHSAQPQHYNKQPYNHIHKHPDTHIYILIKNRHRKV